MSLTFKAFLYDRTWRGDPAEIRRFTVDQDVSSSYAYLLEKVVQVFPSLQVDNVDLAWKDSDGDLITISSDEELVEALDQFEGNIFRLYLRKKHCTIFPVRNPKPVLPSENSGQDNPNPNGGDGEQESCLSGPNPVLQEQNNCFHPGVQCDGCNGPIYGTRFKCLVCRDYDLCSGCEEKGIHVDHNMVSISDPFYNPWGFPFRPFCGQSTQGCGRDRRFGGYPYHCNRSGPWSPCYGWLRPNVHGSNAPQCNPAEKAKCEQEPMDTEQKVDPSSEDQHRNFLQGVGAAVSSFLEPFGVKVDVDVIGGEKSEATTTKNSSDATMTEQSDVTNKAVDEALAHLRSMGYQDEGGWLKELVQSKGGDVTKVLDALHPSVEED